MAAGSPAAPRGRWPTTSGSATSESIAPAAKNERPKTTPPDVAAEEAERGCSEKISVPNSARTIDGVPAIISIVDSASARERDGRPYSLSQTATADPDRERDGHRR